MYYRMREPRGDELDAMTIHFVRDITRVGRISDSPRADSVAGAFASTSTPSFTTTRTWEPANRSLDTMSRSGDG